MERTAAADGAYDDTPTLALPFLSVMPTGKTLAEILDGRPALYVLLAAATSPRPGNFATPVQMAYLLTRLAPGGPGCRNSMLRGNLSGLLNYEVSWAAPGPALTAQRCVMEMTIVR